MAHCHSTPMPSSITRDNHPHILLVGNPNVGKSVLFHQLTGQYVTVSNYPGTTVEVAQGSLRHCPERLVIDTPGIVTFPARSEDEEVTVRALLDEHVGAVIQVGDAKNLQRTLHLTLQLAELGLPLVLVLNMLDEAEAFGVRLDLEPLSRALGVPVVATVATRGQGVDDLLHALERVQPASVHLTYPPEIEEAVQAVIPLLPPAPISARGLALLFLSGENGVSAWLRAHLTPDTFERLEDIRRDLQSRLAEPVASMLQRTRENAIRGLIRQVWRQEQRRSEPLNVRLGRLATHPLWGIPILALVLYGLYWFVGVFGAGTLVGFLEETLFGQIINPWMVSHLTRWIPWPFLQQMLVGDYGLWTMGVTYALALLLPIVVTFFIAFGVLEDSGYLPRLAVLTNQFFSRIGLNGQAVLPMVLGLGCVTMATMTTRILSRPRERILVTFLLALAIPCSAQLGVVMGMLAGISFGATLIWAGVVIIVLLIVGWLAAQVLPGERTPLIVELPPLRWPVLSNVLIKTLARLEWYIKEAVPLFLLGTFLLFVLDWFHLLPGIIQLTEPVVTHWLGLPPEAAAAFLVGFLRRDFAATNLFVMESRGLLSPVQVVVAMVTITLFVPCIASVFMMIKERGLKTALGMLAFIFPFALFVGGALYRLLTLVGWHG